MPDDADLPMETDVETVSAMRQRAETFLLLDVREEDEYALAKIEGSRLIPMSVLRERLDELEADREELIVVHCHHGVRSLRVAQALRDNGFRRVQSMTGGIDQWSQQIDASVPRY